MKLLRSPLLGLHIIDKQSFNLVVISYEIYKTRRNSFHKYSCKSIYKIYYLVFFLLKYIHKTMNTIFWQRMQTSAFIYFKIAWP